MVFTFDSVSPQVRVLFERDDILLKFDYIFTVLNRGIYLDEKSREDTDSLIAFLSEYPYGRLRAIEMWILFPEIAPVWENPTEVLRDLWNEASREVDGRNTAFAEVFPGQHVIEERYATLTPKIRKVFFPAPTPEMEVLRDLTEISNQTRALLIKELELTSKYLMTQKHHT